MKWESVQEHNQMSQLGISVQGHKQSERNSSKDTVNLSTGASVQGYSQTRGTLSKETVKCQGLSSKERFKQDLFHCSSNMPHKSGINCFELNFQFKNK